VTSPADRRMVVEPRKVGVASERNPCGAAAVGCINLERQSSVIVVVRYEAVGIAAIRSVQY